MPLHVLLADDSVPAQNMGKKILVDAGYDVLTVSNGLEALRKIAENAPDIAILDIFMPGYTGLEICERLRASAATAALPVILTVGKLEPYRPEDGEHVHSNAVIVKPFAAAELVSAVRSLIGAALGTVPSHPQVGGDTLSLDSGTDPLQEAAGGVVFPEPSSADQPATPGRPAERSQAVDEPLFFYDPSGSAAPLSAREPSVYADAPLPSDTDSNRPERLAFNPDAEPTPFSASALDDLLPATPHFAAEPTFTEFDLEPESSGYFSTPAPRGSTAEQPPFLAATGMTGPEPELVLPESAIAPEEILSGSGAPLDSTSASLDIPPLDPLLELPEADLPSVASVASRNAVEPLEALAPEVTAAHDEAVPASSAGQLSSDEEARRLAFEALFNSPEPIPLDDTDSHPAIAAPKDDHSGVFAPDSESEPLNLDRQPEFATPETDPYPLTDVKLEEAEPMSVIGQIPDCAPLLEDAPEKAVWSGTECAPELEEAIVSTSSEVDSPELGDAATPESSPVDAQVEAQRMFTAAYPEAAETFEPAHPALISEIEQPPGIEDESVHPAAEAAPEQPELQQVVSETAPLETLPLETVPVEAQQPASEPSHLESDAAAQMESNAAAQTMPVETVPLETMPLETQQAVPLEAMPLENMPQETQQAAPEPVHPDAEAAAEAMPVLPELETPEPVHLQPETHAAEIASSPEPSLGPNDAERVSQAVDRVFNRFKRLLVAAILRELARPD